MWRAMLPLVMGLVFFFPALAQAKKCPPGQYGLTKCKKCPVNTYSSKTGIATKQGCQKCPFGTYAKAGATKCKDKPCVGTINGKKRSVASGQIVCFLKSGLRRKCYRSVFEAYGNCKSCLGKDKKGKSRKYVHNSKRCSQDWWWSCQNGTWLKGKSCKVWKNCMPKGGLPAGIHKGSVCDFSTNLLYHCYDGKWTKGKACPKRACVFHGSEKKHGAKLCKPGPTKGKGTLIQCDNGTWKTIASSCKKKK